jgi:hypothetical protein
VTGCHHHHAHILAGTAARTAATSAAAWRNRLAGGRTRRGRRAPAGPDRPHASRGSCTARGSCSPAGAGHPASRPPAGNRASPTTAPSRARWGPRQLRQTLDAMLALTFGTETGRARPSASTASTRPRAIPMRQGSFQQERPIRSRPALLAWAPARLLLLTTNSRRPPTGTSGPLLAGSPDQSRWIPPAPALMPGWPHTGRCSRTVRSGDRHRPCLSRAVLRRPRPGCGIVARCGPARLPPSVSCPRHSREYGLPGTLAEQALLSQRRRVTPCPCCRPPARLGSRRRARALVRERQRRARWIDDAGDGQEPAGGREPRPRRWYRSRMTVRRRGRLTPDT